MKELLKWRMPPDYLRELRNATPLKSLVSCLISGVFYGVFVALFFSYLLWKPHQFFSPELLFIALGVVFAGTIIRYLLLPYFSPSVVLLNESIYLQYGGSGIKVGNSTYKYRFANISECRMRRVEGKTSHYTLLSVTSNLKNEPAFFRWWLSEKIEIAIPDSVDGGQIAQILRTGGVNVVA
jgi:hypothetical protein